jgi:G3E family GTPase
VSGTAKPARIPVYVVTGYLGSGKTTLIADLLHDAGMAGTAIIVNELAEIGIDQAVIGDVQQGEVVLLSNGCLCCGRGTDLSNAVRQLIASARQDGRKIERILIETSGAADPAPIVRQVCFDPELRASLRYGGVLCLFDTMFGLDLLTRDPVGYRQIALADMVLLTKCDLASSGAQKQAVAKVRSLNEVAVVTEERDQSRAFLSGQTGPVGAAGSQSWLGPAVETSGDTHPQEIGTWTLRIPGVLDWTRAELSMRQIYDRHGDAILRTKGLISTKGDPRPLVIHGINRHFHRPLRLKSWESEPETRLVIIGTAQAKQAADEISSLLQSCAENTGETATLGNLEHEI